MFQTTADGKRPYDAVLLTSGVLDSAYVGLALYAGANVIASVLSFLFARRALTRFRVVTEHSGAMLASLNRLVMFVGGLERAQDEARPGQAYPATLAPALRSS